MIFGIIIACIIILIALIVIFRSHSKNIGYSIEKCESLGGVCSDSYRVGSGDDCIPDYVRVIYSDCDDKKVCCKSVMDDCAGKVGCVSDAHCHTKASSGTCSAGYSCCDVKK